MRYLQTIAFLITVNLFAPVASAGIIPVTSEGDITADGTTQWVTIAADTGLVSEPFTHQISGISGLSAEISKPNGTQLQRRTQSTSWGGNFGVGEALLYSIGSGPIRVEFSEGIEGAGAQIQSNSGGSFTATLKVFDTSDVLLGTVNVAGTSNGNADDSAIFIGVLSDMGNTIGAIEFDVDHPFDSDDDFAINDIRVQQADSSSSTSPVPEAAGNLAWAVLLLVLATMLLSPQALRRRRRGPHYQVSSTSC